MRVTVPQQVRDPVRLAAVRLSALLDSAPEEPFDRLTRLAATVLRTPFAFVTAVDAKRSYWKSCIGISSVDPVDRQVPVEESFCQYVIETGEPLVVEDAAWDVRTRDNPAVRSMGVAAWAGFPVHAPDGQVLGTFCVVDTIPRQWNEEDVEVLRTLAAAATGEVALRAALAETRQQSEHLGDPTGAVRRLSTALQESLVPPVPTVVTGLDLAVLHRPGGTGTDLLCDSYDVVQTGPDACDLVLADVTGRGASAAGLAGLVRHVARAATTRGASPHEVLHQVHEAVLARSAPQQTPVSLAHAKLRATARGFDVTLASGGHPPPLLRRADGSISVLESSPSRLGRQGDVANREIRLSLGAGDVLLLHTDGAVQAEQAGEPFGLQRLAEAVEAAGVGVGAHELAGRAVAAATEWAGGRLTDDVVVLVARVPEETGDGPV